MFPLKYMWSRQLAVSRLHGAWGLCAPPPQPQVVKQNKGGKREKASGRTRKTRRKMARKERTQKGEGEKTRATSSCEEEKWREKREGKWVKD